jgi:hypothetical protein
MATLTVLNFAHPLTADQIDAIKREMRADEVNVIHVPAQFDLDAPLQPQVRDLVEQAMNQMTEKPETLIINYPSLNYAAVLVDQELVFYDEILPAQVSMLRLRPVKGATPPRFEVAEIIH